MDDDDDIPSNGSHEPTIGDVIVARYTRRQALKGLSAVAALSAIGSMGAVLANRPVRAESASDLTFPELPHGMTETHAVADGYDVQTLIRWGDAVAADAPSLDPANQTPDAQRGQWGYNNDFIAYMPLPAGSRNPDHGLLCVNFEYTDHQLMFPGIAEGELDKLTRDQVGVEMAAHGHGVIEVIRDKTANTWSVVRPSTYARRISALDTECALSGPAAGHQRLRTNSDPTGTKVIGTLNNCAGGKTPWGTVLFAEENFHYYFGGDPEKTGGSAELQTVWPQTREPVRVVALSRPVQRGKGPQRTQQIRLDGGVRPLRSGVDAG